MPRTYTAEEAAEIKAKYPDKKGGKQIAGVHTRHVRGEKRVYKYTMEDDTELMEDEDGKKLTKWPEKKAK